MPKRTDPNAEVIELIDNMETPYEVRSAARQALGIDCVNAANNFRVLAQVFDRRADALVGLDRLRPEGA